MHLLLIKSFLTIPKAQQQKTPWFGRSQCDKQTNKAKQSKAKQSKAKQTKATKQTNNKRPSLIDRFLIYIIVPW
jgi:hypothetical protein